MSVSSGNSVGVLGGVRSGKRRTKKISLNEYKDYPILNVALNADIEELHTSNQTQLTALSNSRFLMYVYHESLLRLVYVQRRNREAVVRLFELESEKTDAGPVVSESKALRKYLTSKWGSPEKSRSVNGVRVWRGVDIESLVELFRLEALDVFTGDAPSYFVVATRVEPKNGPAVVKEWVDGKDVIEIASSSSSTDKKGEMYRATPKSGNFLFPDLGIRDKTMPLPEPQTLFNLIVSGGGSVRRASEKYKAEAGLLEKLNETTQEKQKRAEAVNRYKLLLHETFSKQEKKMKKDDKPKKSKTDDEPFIVLQKSENLSSYQLKVVALCQKLKPSKLYKVYDEDDLDDYVGVSLPESAELSDSDEEGSALLSLY